MRKEVVILALALVLTLSIVSANKSPEIRDLKNEILVCESSAASIKFVVADLDGDKLNFDISPNNPFFVRSISSKAPITEFEIFSNNFTKLQSNQEYITTFHVSDGEFVDAKRLKIKVLEKNNPPVIQPILVSTVDLNKTSKFQKTVYISDIESQKDSDFIYTVSDPLNLLDLKIDALGIINYTVSEKHIGVHEVEVCAIDNSVKSLEGKIGFCGSKDLTEKSCKKFQLAITKANSPPTILVANSSNLTGKIFGIEKTTYQIYKYDPDGLHPDTLWYVDGQLKKISSGSSQDSFTYSFGCDKFGVHRIKAVITDGLANDSVEWKFDVIKIPCENGILPSEKIGDEKCEEKWGCLDWSVCQSAQRSLENNVISSAEFLEVQRKCNSKNWNEENCGYQTRDCLDINQCNSIKNQPLELSPCYFSLEPSCSDKIQNCHDGDCEFMVDCGGTCFACATCSDGLRNQNEEGTDCGGPCVNQCFTKSETDGENRFLKQSMVGAILIGLLISVIQIARIFHNKKVLEDKPKQEIIVKYESS